MIANARDVRAVGRGRNQREIRHIKHVDYWIILYIESFYTQFINIPIICMLLSPQSFQML